MKMSLSVLLFNQSVAVFYNNNSHKAVLNLIYTCIK